MALIPKCASILDTDKHSSASNTKSPYLQAKMFLLHCKKLLKFVNPTPYVISYIYIHRSKE